MLRALSLAVVLLATGCGRPSADELAASSTFAAGRAHGRFESIRGLRTFAMTTGSGPDVVLLHGNPASVYTWRKLIEPLSANYRVHAFDFPGFGFSDKPAEASYTGGWLAGHVVAYLDAHGIERAVLIGSSMGGEIASEVAVLYPRRVAALILIAPGGLPADEDIGLPLGIRMTQWPVIGPLIARFPARALIGASLRDAMFDPDTITEADIEAYYLPLRTEGGMNAFLARLSAKQLDRTPLVRRITAPTLVLVGDTDRHVPTEVARRYHELIDGSALVEFEKTGHLPQEERPRRVLAAIDTWLPQQLTAAAAAATSK